MPVNGVWYATEEQVRSSLEIIGSRRSKVLIRQKLEHASRAVEGLLHRRFYPEIRTVAMDWPNYQYGPPWTLYLGDNELISLTTLTSGGTVIPGADVILRRDDDRQEPPYNRIEIKLSSASAFAGGITFQQSAVMLGAFGYNATDTSLAACALGANINSSVTTIVLNPVAGQYPIGVGSILLIGTERLILADRLMSDTAINSGGALTALQSGNTLPVPDGTLFSIDEIILIDAERMRISDIAGNNLIVDRAWDGTTLAAHNTNSDIFALHTFVAKRGQLGTTAAAHVTTDPIYVHDFPGSVNELALAETVCALEQNSSAYARVVGSGPNARESAGKGLEDVRNTAVQTYGRKARLAAI